MPESEFLQVHNETRNGIEDSSRHDGLRALAAVNGTVAGAATSSRSHATRFSW